MGVSERRAAARMLAMVLAYAALGLGCTENQGLRYDRVSVRAHHEDGTAVAGFPSPACTTLPLLLGSRVTTKEPLGHAIVVVVDADRDRVAVSFEGVARSETVVLSADALGEGAERSVAVQDATSNERYVVTIVGGCPSAAPSSS